MSDPRLTRATGQVIDALVERATTDADPDDVTPPLSPGWSPERVAWLRTYLCRCSGGPDSDEHVWAVVVDGRPAGAVRLRRTSDPTTLETGIWLARSVRGHGVATRALAAVLEEAWARGAEVVLAETATTNHPARAALLRNGFALTPADDPTRVRALRHRAGGDTPGTPPAGPPR